ncbi:hypothetical protein T265_07199 [Opisthorchis viverrini]|uniref:Uncharacterized protein n=1 Tax=Opisthorchis viverrini TaxID=6198 RepID=A0A075AC87_OPIVI|nr:hypothetical protein T265_07199 [Opisthorchis viverrini]KER25324.1 hypothetical protein T265_07199 [Opisthorchis viverrini]
MRVVPGPTWSLHTTASLIPVRSILTASATSRVRITLDTKGLKLNFVTHLRVTLGEEKKAGPPEES